MGYLQRSVDRSPCSGLERQLLVYSDVRLCDDHGNLTDEPPICDIAASGPAHRHGTQSRSSSQPRNRTHDRRQARGRRGRPQHPGGPRLPRGVDRRRRLRDRPGRVHQRPARELPVLDQRRRTNQRWAIPPLATPAKCAGPCAGQRAHSRQCTQCDQSLESRIEKSCRTLPSPRDRARRGDPFLDRLSAQARAADRVPGGHS